MAGFEAVKGPLRRARPALDGLGAARRLDSEPCREPQAGLRGSPGAAALCLS